MAMTGLTGLALGRSAGSARLVAFCLCVLPINSVLWGGDNGGWAEAMLIGAALSSSAAFQDILWPLATRRLLVPFWKNSPYFALYNVQPYCTPSLRHFQCGRFNLDPNVADYMLHVLRVFQNGYFPRLRRSFDDQRRARPIAEWKAWTGCIRPLANSLSAIHRQRQTIARGEIFGRVAATTLLPGCRLGFAPQRRRPGPAEDIQITFKSSPYGSSATARRSNALLSRLGEASPSTPLTGISRLAASRGMDVADPSKNALLIDGLGQKAQDKTARQNHSVRDR